jgi:hypothetical protein
MQGFRPEVQGFELLGILGRSGWSVAVLPDGKGGVTVSAAHVDGRYIESSGPSTVALAEEVYVEATRRRAASGA